MLLGKIEVEVLEGWRLREKETGLIMPWYTWPCLEWLVTLDLKRKKVFEYGLGDSTKWYMSKGANCYGVDNNIEWWKNIREHAGPLKASSFCFVQSYQGAEAYAERPKFSNWPYDVIVIDGIYRDECTEYALMHLKSGGLLILDNYKQPSVEEHWPLTEKLIEGMPITIYKQPNHADWQTAVITKL